MNSALIGHSGFVGGNLLRQRSFDDLYNSKNIESIAGRAYDLVVCAGMPAEKWKANQNPEADRAAVERLMNALRQVKAQQMILISTVDVYPVPIDVDEDSRPDWTLASAYGRHRRALEEFLLQRFAALVARLPGLFGAGLKKNIIYDLLRGNQLDKIHADARFQFYGLDHLWADLAKAQAARVAVCNMATEPVSVEEVAREAFGIDFQNRPEGALPARYDVRSQHAALFGGGNGYLKTKAQVMAEMKDFVNKEKNKP
jgi:nucleoside-diphosphate-sugar epimerase